MKLVKQEELPELGVSHNPDIKKKTFISAGEIPQLMMFGSVIFQPGQSVSLHKHDTMTEVFFIQKGKAEFVVEEKTMVLEPGHCITIEAGELHAQNNPFSKPVEWLYFGIALD